MRSMTRSPIAPSATAIATSSRSGRSRSSRIEFSLSPRKLRKLPRHLAIDLAPERHDEIGDAVEPLPAPGIELRRLIVARHRRIDFVVAAGKSQCEPCLALPAEFCEPVR